MDFKKAFRQLNGHDPSPKKILEFERTCSALETTPTDAMLCVLMALDHYENLYTAIPSKIKASADQTLAGLQIAIDLQAKASVESVQASLIDSVSIAAQRVAKDVAKMQKVQWVCGAIIVTSLVAGAFGWYFHKMGRNDGYSLGYGIGHRVAMDEIATALWANTGDGKLAYKLSMSTRIADLVNCSNAGWQIKNGVCYPFASADGKITGWRIP